MRCRLLLFLMSLLPLVASADEVEIGGIRYLLASNNSTARVTTGQSPSKITGDIVIPESVTYMDVAYRVIQINDGAFTSCTGMTSVVIPGSVETISNYAFQNCSSLSAVTIGSGINKIGGAVFYLCTALTNVYCLAESVPRTTADAFDNSNVAHATLYVPSTAVSTYQTAAPWSSFSAIVALEAAKPKCAKPVINYIDGKLQFTCETEDVEFHYEVVAADATKGKSPEVSLSGVYTVSVYATKSGYDDSDVTTANIEVRSQSGNIKGDVNDDGTVDIADAVKIVNLVVGKVDALSRSSQKGKGKRKLPKKTD